MNNDPVQRSAEWIYGGVWKILTDCFRVPQHPPSLPAQPGAAIRTFHPSLSYLAYLKLYFWIALVVIDLAILAIWVVLLVFQPLIAWILALPLLAVAIVPDIVAYVAIHLRYDTMWYVMSERSLRIRRGIWEIVEHTITFENVQDIHLRRGPIQQLFGITTIVVETAGAAEGEHQDRFAVGNKAIMEGIDKPDEIRQLILERVRATRSAGLGDEPAAESARGFSAAHVRLLGEIRDEVRKLNP